MLANRTSRWSLGTALLCVVVLVACWFLLVSPRRSEAADLRDQATSAESRIGVLQAQIAELTRQFGDLDKKRAELAAIRAQMPAAADVPRLVRSLQDNAAAAGVTLVSVSPSAPTALTDANGGATSGVVAVPLTIELTGTYVESTLYLKYLQTRLQRAFLVTGITLAAGEQTAAGTTSGSPAAGLEEVSLTITGQVFVLPATATGTATGTASATATPSATAAPGASATTPAPAASPTAAPQTTTN